MVIGSSLFYRIVSKYMGPRIKGQPYLGETKNKYMLMHPSFIKD